LERLQHVLFIKGAFAGGTIKAASRTAFQHFTEEASIITLDELLGKTIYYLVGDAVARKGSLVPTAPEQIVGIYQREALRSLHALLEDLRKQGASLTSLKPTWFTIYGYDFSTGRRVENPEKRE
jgi:hypothetical protein